MVTIVDYGMGNLRSVQKAFERIKVKTIITSKNSDLENADLLVLPGVGHFKKGMDNLRQLGLIEIINFKVLQQKTPVLGICLGMQLMTNYSEEGETEGLKWIDGVTKKFNFPKIPSLKIPHMGWNQIQKTKHNSLLNNFFGNELFYFVHSYFITCNNPDDIIATTVYGNEFVSAFHAGNITGFQFHPEKSLDSGLLLLENFIKYYNVPAKNNTCFTAKE